MSLRSNPCLATVPRRPFRDGVELSVLGFGGIIVCKMDQRDADAEVEHAVERGVNYFDVAPGYGDGEAEVKLGLALEPHRASSFLACKTARRDAAGAGVELIRSLERLRTDYFDLYQLHGIASLAEAEQALAPGGALETLVSAKRDGRVRAIGFSAHSEEAALWLLDRYDFDSILYPVNFVCYAQGNFGPSVLAKAKERGTARLALKALAYTPLDQSVPNPWSKAWYRPIAEADLARRALAFTLGEDVTAAIPPGHAELFRMALDLAMDLEPLSTDERDTLLAEAAGLVPLFPIVAGET